MLNGAVKGEEEKTSLDGAGSPPYNCFKIMADCNYSCCGGEEAEREGEWKKEQPGGLGTPHGYQGFLGCDGRWQLALTSENPVPFFGPCWGTVAAQALSLQLPGPAERPPPLPSAFATGSPWDLHQDCRLVRGDLCSSSQLAVDVWQVGFPLGPHTQKW